MTSIGDEQQQIVSPNGVGIVLSVPYSSFEGGGVTVRSVPGPELRITLNGLFVADRGGCSRPVSFMRSSFVGNIGG